MGLLGLQMRIPLVLGVIRASNFSTGGSAKPSSMLEGTVTILAPAEMANAM